MGSEDNQKQCKETIKDGDGIRMREKQGQKNFPYISTPTHLKADQETKQKEMKCTNCFQTILFYTGPTCSWVVVNLLALASDPFAACR